MVANNEELCACRVIHQERVERAKRGVLAVGKIEEIALLFKAISDPGRIKILLALEHGEMCVCDLAAFLGVTESAVSHQLRTLRQLKLVANRREGAVLYYRLNKKIANELLATAVKHIE